MEHTKVDIRSMKPTTVVLSDGLIAHRDEKLHAIRSPHSFLEFYSSIIQQRFLSLVQHITKIQQDTVFTKHRARFTDPRPK
uniref:Uncharacterized protein n=1 Tax=Anguilla anguilla TaxID=7936 RepID=A0A0E9X7L6_ANGAN